MKLKHVRIFSNVTSETAENIINDFLERCEGTDIAVNFELMIENTVSIAGSYDTRYTLIVHEYEITEVYDAGD